jgi:carboxypeptidase C (cathepsin A)
MNDLPYILFLPTYTADAWYHKKLPADLQSKSLEAVLGEAENFVIGPYTQALAKGDRMTAAERKEAIAGVARYTGLEARYVDQSNLRIDVQHFTRELLRDQRRTIGRLDGRLTGPSPMDAGETAEFDPSGTLINPPFVAAFSHYMRTELGYKTDMSYTVSGGVQPWDYNSDNRYADTSGMLRTAFARNPHLKVMVSSGYYDLATPYFAAEYTFAHMGLHPEMQKNVIWKYYEAGHMYYIDRKEHAKMKRDLVEMLEMAIPKR